MYIVTITVEYGEYNQIVRECKQQFVVNQCGHLVVGQEVNIGQINEGQMDGPIGHGQATLVAHRKVVLLKMLS